MTRLVAVGLLCALAAPAADRLEGRVWELAGDERRPLAKAVVRVTPDRRGAVPSMARSDAEGRWRVGGPLRGRFYVSASRPGFFVKEADGVETSSVLLACSDACGPIEFTLQRGGIVTGVVEDDQGEPLQNVSVRLEDEQSFESDENDDSDRRFRGRGSIGRDSRGPRAAGGDRTDDRGRFRIAGLRPGRYRAVAEFFGRPDASRYVQDEPLSVDIAAGEETALRITAVRDRTEALRVSGVVTGVDLSRPGRRVLQARPASNSTARSRTGRRMWTLEEDGKFELEGLPPGRYYFSYAFFPNRNASRETPLGWVDLQRNTTGLTLSPVPTVEVSGRFELDSDREIRGASVALIPKDRSPSTQIYTGGVDRDFQRGGLQPGTYEVFLRSRDWFLAGVRIGEEEMDPDAVPITANVHDLVIVLSDRFARVEGKLRPGGERYMVTLASGERREGRPTDQNGGFVFERLAPGEYTICVRPLDAGPDSECVVERRFPVEADSVIELELSLP